MSTIGDTDVSDLSPADAADAFLSQWLPEGDPDAPKKKEPSEKGTTENEDPPADDKPKPSEETPEDDGEPEADDKAEKKAKKFVEEDDSTYIKVKVGEDEHEVPVKDLKRLFGQESALTKKSQETAELRKAAEAEQAKATASIQALLQRAQARAEPYKKIDFLVAAQQLTVEELTAIRAQANEAFEEEKFLTTELNGYMQAQQAQVQKARTETAQATIKALADPTNPYHIEG